jgi:hypothetical protein
MRNALAYVGFAIVAVGVTMYILQGMIEFWPYSLYLALVAVIVVGSGVYVITRGKTKE